MKAVIFPNFQKNNALETARSVCDILNKNEIEVYIDNNYINDFSDKPFVKFGVFDKLAVNADFAIAIGGDGTILKCAKHIIGLDIKLLGINTGRLGFMSAIEYDQLQQLDALKTGNYTVSERMMLKAEVLIGNKKIASEALNDVSVSSVYSNICDFDISINENIIGSYRADGAVFSTPTGSTAYSLSAGGPIIEPEMNCIEMTLICPHSLFARPMIFSPDKKITFENSSRRNPDMYVSIDGNKPLELTYGSKVNITASEHKIKIIDIKRNTFYNSLNRKLMHPIK